jgi:NIPSNAP.
MKKLAIALFLIGMSLQAEDRVYELRTYTAAEGKLENVLARFRDHTAKLFEKHGMVNIGYWVPQDAPLSKNTLIYVLAHKSREAAKKSWHDFQTDPEWVKVKTESEANGKIVEKVVSVFMTPADFSKLK